MESGDIKVCQLQARKVAQDVLMSEWHKQGVIKTKTKFTFEPEILNSLCDLLTIELVRNGYVWEDFLRNNFDSMTKTPYRFANYFAYASYILFEEHKDAHACFIAILSLATHFTLYCWQEKKEDKRFLNLCVDLFCAFFDKELCEKFEHQGRWKNFNKHLKNHAILKRHREQTRTDQINKIYREFEWRHESKEPYVINNVVLKEITVEEVENDQKAVSFADSVGDKIKEAFEKEFEEILKSFSEIDRQLEIPCQETVGETSDGMTSAKDKSSLKEVQENAFKNIPSNLNSKKDKGQTKKIKENTAFKEASKDSPKKDSQKVPNKVKPKKDKSKKTKGNTALKNFPKMDSQEEKLHRETVGVASGEMTSGGDQSSSQQSQEAAEKIPRKNNPEKIEDGIKEGKASYPMKTQDIDSLKPLDLSPASKKSDPSPKLTKVGRVKALSDSIVSRDSSQVSKESDPSPKLTELNRAKVRALLEEMLIYNTNIGELIKFVCEDNEVKVPI